MNRLLLPALCGIVMLAILPACSEDQPLTPPADHLEAEGLALVHGSDVVCSIFRGLPSDSLQITLATPTPWYDIKFYDADTTLIEPDRDPDHTLSWTFADSTRARMEQDAADPWRVRFHGLAAGATTIEFFVLHQGHADFRSGQMPLRVAP